MFFREKFTDCPVLDIDNKGDFGRGDKIRIIVSIYYTIRYLVYIFSFVFAGMIRRFRSCPIRFLLKASSHLGTL